MLYPRRDYGAYFLAREKERLPELVTAARHKSSEISGQVPVFRFVAGVAAGQNNDDTLLAKPAFSAAPAQRFSSVH
ncbi:MAG: hypothetical protein LAN64_05355 [Acidobacteriia bacterium]|nr:hypothetical protein [Terriglobia bacterium]